MGAVLTQNTAWTNVVRALDNLKAASLLDLHALHHIPQEQLALHIRPSGYYNLKAGRLKNLMQAIVAHGGDLESLFARDDEDLRALLLAVTGIGPETADSICLYAANRPIFVIDAYTRRILSRHGRPEAAWGYDDLRAFFEEALPRDVRLYKDLHAYLVFIGKDYCRPRNPRCDGCPLARWSSP